MNQKAKPNLDLTKFKFYHGTSTIFAESIRQTGLGTLNPNIDFKHLEVLNYLFLEAEKYLANNVTYQKVRITTMAMVDQSTVEFIDNSGTSKRLHFRHDGIYVALSLMRAIIYASTNAYGSEILQRCVDLFKMLKSKIPDFTIPPDINLSKIDTLANCNPTPIIIEVSDIDDDDLTKEDGKTAKEALEFLRRTIPTLTEKEKYEFLQYCNFELLKPILPEKLKLFKLILGGRPGDKDFKYKLVEY